MSVTPKGTDIPSRGTCSTRIGVSGGVQDSQHTHTLEGVPGVDTDEVRTSPVVLQSCLNGSELLYGVCPTCSPVVNDAGLGSDRGQTGGTRTDVS